MKAFIVRPFGTKEIVRKDKKTDEVTTLSLNFEKVEEELIAPALKSAGIDGGTTGKIFEAGDIREDMFSLLLLADLVIADITMHNANAFYELGIRHSLRDQKTILIKCGGFDDTPFDIQGLRYISYNKEKPGEALENLIQAINETVRANRKDSPVFNILPWLKPTDTEQFLIVPDDFKKELEVYVSVKQLDRVALLAEEVKGFIWEVPALRKIGEGQFQLKDYEGAKQSWSQVKQRKPDDQMANDRLSTIYNRLAEASTSSIESLTNITLSDQAITQLLDHSSELQASKKAEIYALRARNSKAKWTASWTNKVNNDERRIAALVSPFLKQTFEDYERGFNEDLNHYYSGGNALGMLSIIIALAEGYPDVWELDNGSPLRAQMVLLDYKEKHKQLGVVVMASLEAAQKRMQQAQNEDPWVAIAIADLNCMILNKAESVGLLYQKAMTKLKDFNLDSARRQLIIYKQLSILLDNVEAALKQFPEAKAEIVSEKTEFLLFTGHMIDKINRVDKDGNPDPRFPPEKEASARKAIYDKVSAEQKKVTGELIGLAGGACGGDILFHEVCKELGIKTKLMLALPRDQFLNESVQFAGTGWVDRFDALFKDSNVEKLKLADSNELPEWLTKKKGYSFWERTNLWMLNNALSNGGQFLTLIALWDGKPADDGGGTQHLVNQARIRGGKVEIINVLDLT